MLEKLGFLQLVAEAVTGKRPPKAMSMPRFVLAMVLASSAQSNTLHRRKAPA